MNQQALNFLEVQNKLSSKRDLYYFLSQDCKAHLPNIKQTNSYFLSEILKGDKNYISREKIKVSSIPHLEGLTVNNLLNMAQQSEEVMSYLPNPRDWKKIDRQWLGDILNSIVPQELEQLISNSMHQRLSRQMERRQLNIHMRPEFADAFNRCMNVASSKGRAASLLKPLAKRRRTQQELEETKDEEMQLRQNKHEFMLLAKRMKTELEQVQLPNQSKRQLNIMSDNFAQRSSMENHPLQSQSLNKQQFNQNML